MDKSTDTGLNRSGLATAPVMAPQMLENSELTHPTMEGDGTILAIDRATIAREAEPAVTMPPPGSLKQLAKSAVKMLQGEKANVFVDKLGERLAFERSGARLYEALLSKFRAFGSFEGGPTESQLQLIYEQEVSHFLLLNESMTQLGADPTAVTPSANLHDVMASGLRQVLTDPRTDLRQCLEAVLLAELVDNDCWSVLTRLAVASGQDDLATKFRSCLEDEQRHLIMVRGWVATGLSVEAFGSESQLMAAPPPPATGGSTTKRSRKH